MIVSGSPEELVLDVRALFRLWCHTEENVRVKSVECGLVKGASAQGWIVVVRISRHDALVSSLIDHGRIRAHMAHVTVPCALEAPLAVCKTMFTTSAMPVVQLTGINFWLLMGWYWRKTEPPRGLRTFGAVVVRFFAFSTGILFNFLAVVCQ